MTVILTDSKQHRFRFTLTRPPHGVKPAPPAFTFGHQALTFLNSLKATQEDWSALHTQLKLDTSKDTSKDTTAIKQQLAEGMIKKQLYLIRAEPAMPPTIIVNTPGTGSTGRSPAKTAQPPILDTYYPPLDIPPPPAKERPNNKTALQHTQPSQVADAPTGAASHAETETRGCPISMVSGEEVLPLEDAVLPGPLPFIWTRFYRTGHRRDHGLGHGWTHSGSERLTLHDHTVVITDDEGRDLTFARPRLHQRSRLINEGLDLDYAAPDCFILKQPGQGDKVFTRLAQSQSADFRLTQLRHPAYQVAEDRPFHTHDELGFCIDFHYDAHHQLTRIQGNWGKALKISRDAKARITRLTLVNSLRLVNQHPQAEKTLAEYDYDEQNDLIAHRNAAGQGERYQYSQHLITRRTLITGFSYHYQWDRLDNHARCLRNWGDDGIYDYHFGWDPDNRRSQATDSRGYTTHFIYNEFGQIIQETDPEGGEHRYTYENGRKTGYTDPRGHTTTYFYNKDNQPTGERDALGHYQGAYYFQGNPTSITDKDGTTWRREYNRRGLLSTLTDPQGQSHHYDYHDSGLLYRITDPQGRTHRYHWNPQGELQQINDPDGSTQRLYYDDWGQIREHHHLPAQGQTDTPVSASTTATAHITRYYHNLTGHLEKIIGPHGETRHYHYNDQQQLIQYSDPQGRLTAFTYDGLSQLTTRTNPDGQTLHYHYDKERNLTRLTTEKGEHHHFAYDGCERLIQETGVDGRQQHYHYNLAGQLIRHDDSDTLITDFERDALGQMVTKTSRHRHNAQPEERSRYLYDGAGRLRETYNAHQYLAFDYDPFGNLQQERHSDLVASANPDTPLDIIDGSTLTLSYETASSGQRSALTLPDGQRIDYTYTEQQQLDSLRLNGQLVTQLQHDAQGRESQRQQGQLTTHSDYDLMGRLTRQRVMHPQTQKSPLQRDYGYDSFSNLNHLKEGGHEVRYVYDLLDRLKKTDGSLDERFDFDPAGNLVSLSEQPQQTIKASPSAPQRTPQQTNIKGNRLLLQGDRKFEYDERGNLIRESRGKGGKRVTDYTYNLQNQLIQVNKAGQSTHYTYDPLGRRIEKRDAFGSTRYLWAEDQLVQESRQHLKKTYLYEPHSFRPVALVQDEQIYHYHLDHLGTPKALTSDTGKVVWQVKYRTYGNVALQETEEIENNLRFQGQYYDEETGLHYNRHRYYNPNTGQFITQDPIGLLGGLNHYQYADNPTGWIDPLGLCKETEHRPPQEPGLQGVFPEALILAPLGMVGRFVGVLRVTKSGPKIGGGGTLNKLSPNEIKRIQNAANRSGQDIGVVGSRVNPNKPLHSKSDYDFVVNANSKTRNNLSRSLPGAKNKVDPRFETVV